MKRGLDKYLEENVYHSLQDVRGLCNLLISDESYVRSQYAGFLLSEVLCEASGGSLEDTRSLIRWAFGLIQQGS